MRQGFCLPYRVASRNNHFGLQIAWALFPTRPFWLASSCTSLILVIFMALSGSRVMVGLIGKLAGFGLLTGINRLLL